MTWSTRVVLRSDDMSEPDLAIEPCDVCGDWCKRGGLPEGRIVYVGDGYSDRCPALAAERVFARAGLADYLEREGRPYEPFETLGDVLAALES